MTVVFVMNDIFRQNKDATFVGCYDDMESCKQAIIEDATEYINKNEIQSDEISNDESYYVVFDTNTKEEKGKFFVHDFKVNIKIEVII